MEQVVQAVRVVSAWVFLLYNVFAGIALASIWHELRELEDAIRRQHDDPRERQRTR
jgi:hypothetical protein